MNYRQLLSGVFAILIAGTASAQDQIYKSNGDVIDAKIKSVSRKSITYKMYDNPEGPDYIIEKDRVNKIEYENGDVVRYSEDGDNYSSMTPPMPGFMARRKAEMDERLAAKNETYGNNILALSPLQITDRGIGLGVSYERVLDKKNIVSLYLPFVATFNDDDFSGSNQDRYSLQFMPGLKIYPTGSKGIVRYSIGPSFFVSYGESRDYDTYLLSYPPYNYVTYQTNRERFSLGMIVNNTLNINPTPHLYLGLELGLGVSYIDRIGGINYGSEGLAQFGFKVGYRF